MYVLVALLFCCGGLFSKVSSAETILKVGVYASLSPFSFKYKDSDGNESDIYVTKSGPLRSNGFDGYMVHICDEVLKQMALPHLRYESIGINNIDVIEVKEHNGFELLDKGGIDILCGPNRIEIDRVREYSVSPPLFVTGISYLTLKNTRPPNKSKPANMALLGGVNRGQGLEEGIQKILRDGNWRKYRKDITRAIGSCIGYGQKENKCTDRGGGKEKEASGGKYSPEGIVWMEGISPESVADLFCEGKIAFYVGDLEIITDSVRKNSGCDWTSGLKTYTNDRYAVFAKVDYSNKEKALHVARFFEILNKEIASTNDSILDRAYRATFGLAPQSRQLKLFYWGIRGSS